jgi:hypothetical protein
MQKHGVFRLQFFGNVGAKVSCGSAEADSAPKLEIGRHEG